MNHNNVMHYTAKITAWSVFFIAIIPLLLFAVFALALYSLMTIFAALYDGAEKIRQYDNLCQKNTPAKNVEIIR